MTSTTEQAIRDHMTHPVTLDVCVVVTVLAVISGPFGTYEYLTLTERCLYWGAITFGSTMAAYVLRRLALQVVPKDRPVLYELVVTGLMVVVVTPMVLVLTHVFMPGLCGGSGCFGRISVYVALIAGAIFVLRRVIPGFEELLFFVRDEAGGLRVLAPSPVPVGDAPLAEASPRPRLYRRLPDGETGDILHLTANGHFVTVTLDTGVQQLRMRFGDAVNEMDCVEGRCTHRSHWVTLSAVAGHRRVDGKQVLVLINAMEVPVSRTYRPGLEEAGLLPAQAAEGA
ncbi:LytTR family DNA-binding domain-containing protein [Lacimonas salitolerans]|uniref:LytTR family DNA-binding domain-containing protein n=1 Tax=Lacimonas salitolerans TaxID=1323750 RepID=A0ABW4EBP4_9RHOB